MTFSNFDAAELNRVTITVVQIGDSLNSAMTTIYIVFSPPVKL